MYMLALINNSRNSFQNKVGVQKSVFLEISIEIKSAQLVCCYEAGPFGSKLDLLGDLVQATLMLNYNKRSVG